MNTQNSIVKKKMKKCRRHHRFKGYAIEYFTVIVNHQPVRGSSTK